MGVFTGEGTSLRKKFREWASYSVTKLHFSVRVCFVLKTSKNAVTLTQDLHLVNIRQLEDAQNIDCHA